MQVPHFVGVYGSRGSRGGGYIRPLPSEHYFPVYHNLSDTRAMSSGGSADRRRGDTAVVGAGGSRPRLGGREDVSKGDEGGHGGRCGNVGKKSEGRVGIGDDTDK